MNFTKVKAILAGQINGYGRYGRDWTILMDDGTRVPVERPGYRSAEHPIICGGARFHGVAELFAAILKLAGRVPVLCDDKPVGPGYRPLGPTSPPEFHESCPYLFPYPDEVWGPAEFAAS